MIELLRVKATDFCVLSEMDVPLSRQGLVFISAENRDTAAADSNGSGKTTIFKAITWCLFDQCVDGDTGDAVIRRGTKKAEVTIQVELTSGIWTITRTRRKGSPGLEIVAPGGEAISESRAELNARIVKMIGLDFDAFKNTVLYGANDINKFADPRTKDADRKRMLHCILRTSILQVAHKVALTKVGEVRAEIAGHERIIGEKTSAIEAVDVAAIQDRSDRWGHERDERKSGLVGSVQAWQAKAKAIEVEDGPVDEIDARLAELKESERKFANRARPADGFADKMDELKDIGQAIRTKITECETRMTTDGDVLDSLGDDDCPLCRGSLGSGDAAVHIRGLRDRRAEDQKTATALEARAKGLRVDYQNARDKRDEARQAGQHAARVRKQIVVAEGERSEAGELRTKREAARRTAIQNATTALEKAKTVAREKNPHTASLREAETKTKGWRTERKRAERDKADCEMTMAHWQFWVKGYSNKGLSSFMLDSSMPTITERANHYLETLADGDIAGVFRTQRELKSKAGQVRDDIDIVWTIEGNEGVRPSSGQLTKINVATDLALMDLAAGREGGSLNLLMLDEVLDGLDAEGTERILQLIQELKTKRGSVFVISHGSSMSEIFERSLRVVKENGAATVERVA